MKKLIVMTFAIFIITVYAQKIKGKSNEIAFKGSSVIAEEIRLEGEKRGIADEKRTAEDLQLEEARKKAEKLDSLTLESLGLTQAQMPRYFALIIGVSDYKYSSPTLPNLDQPVNDAKRLRDVLVKQYSFDSMNVSLLLNPEKRNIIQDFEILSETLTEKDNLLIFYAGHGYFDKSKDFGYWLASDAEVNDRSSWLGNSVLKDYLGSLKTKHTLLVADACFSGSIFKSRNVDAPNVVMKFHETYKDKSRRAMTSGSLTTVPDKSVFIQQLLRVLEGNKDLFLTSSQLFTRIYEPVLSNSPTRPLFGVIQGVGDEGGDFVFIKRN